MDKLISKLSHVVVTTPKLEESARFYHDLLGLEISHSDDSSVWFRGWGEHYQHCLQLTSGPTAALRVTGWRAQGAEQLKQAVARIEASGQGEGWVDPAFGRGPAYRYRAPGGRHLHEIFWEVDWYKAPEHLATRTPGRAQLWKPRGIGVREFDHATVSSRDVRGDVAWFRDTLGHRFMEYVTLEDSDKMVFAMTTTGERGHDMAFLIDAPHQTERVNHIAFWVDQRVDLFRAADVILEAGLPVEYGPGRHGLGEQEYLYFREPSGLRIELNAGGYRNTIPDWQAVGWVPSQGANDWYRNTPYPKSMFQSFPAEEDGQMSNALYTDFKGVVG